MGDQTETTGQPGAPATAAEKAAADMAPEELSYEQARTELAAVVERLEAGGVSLEESLALWERGEQLAGICQRWLEGARERLDAARRSRGSG